ncbi:MAG: hypothetical protein EXR51_04240 [Dehalococcoidia bacterium]|nr:hypothetical protein [Dehalococcoidia bacterium]
MTLLPTVTTRFPVFNLWIQRPFSCEGYQFTPAGGFAGYQERLRRVLASPDHVHTVDVTREAGDGEAAPGALLWDSGERIDDLMLLLSLGQGRSIHYREAHWAGPSGNDGGGESVHRSFGGGAMFRGEQAVSPFEIEEYLTGAFSYLRLPQWVEDRGFATGAHWYLESLAAPHPDIRSVAAWNGMMAVVKRYFKGGWEGTDASSPVTLLLAFRDAHEYDFILDEQPELWQELSRDCLERHPQHRYLSARHSKIYTHKLQLVLLLTLLDMVGLREFSRRESLLRDIRR